jgi:hypothetical protein
VSSALSKAFKDGSKDNLITPSTIY